MTILITGGNGFLGKHVVQEMRPIRSDMECVVIPNSKELNLLDRNKLLHYLDVMQPTAILHMAALCGGILANKNSPADFLHKNIDMASNLYYAAKETGCQTIYSLGSVCGYPKYCPVPFKEDNLWNGYPEETNAPYGLAKRLLLMLHQTYREQYGFKGAHLIPVNLYGPYDHFDLTNSHVIPALIRKFTEATMFDKPYVECWGTGSATREFLYVSDAAEAISKAVLTGFDSELPINLGTGKDISIKDLAYLIKDLSGFKGEIVFNGTVSDGQPKRMLDVSRAEELLGWKAKTDLTFGLNLTLQWYRNHISPTTNAQLEH